MKTSHIDGDLNVARRATIGGDLTVRRDATFDHNLEVKGWLEANNIKGFIKGLYATAEDLMAAYPSPDDGWAALVVSGEYVVMYAAKNGAWTTTGARYEFNIPVADLDSTTVASMIDAAMDNYDPSKTEQYAADMQAIQESLAGKASTESVASVSEALSKAMEAHQAAQSALTQINELLTELNNVKDTAGDNSTAIGNITQNIAHINGLVNGFAITLEERTLIGDTPISAKVAQIEATSSSLVSTVAAMNMGNLLMDGAFEMPLIVNEKRGVAVRDGSVAVDPLTLHNGYDTLLITSSGATSAVYQMVCWHKVRLENGKQYTLSFWYKAEAVGSEQPQLFMESYQTSSYDHHVRANGIYLDRESITAYGTWTKKEVTFTATMDTNTAEVVIGLVQNGSLWIAEPMLNEGSTALPFRQSASGIADVIGSMIQQTASGIYARVVSALRTTGINIEDGEIKLIAGKTGFYPDLASAELDMPSFAVELDGDTHDAVLQWYRSGEKWYKISSTGMSSVINKGKPQKYEQPLVLLGEGNSVTLNAEDVTLWASMDNKVWRYIAARNDQGMVTNDGAHYDGKYYMYHGDEYLDPDNNAPTNDNLQANGIVLISIDRDWMMGENVAFGWTSQTKTVIVQRVKDGVLGNVMSLVVSQSIRMNDGDIDTYGGYSFYPDNTATKTISFEDA